jgi:hypothetical protein
MGIERTVTLWYLHRQMLLQELASLEAQLLLMHTASEHQAVQSQATDGSCNPPLEIEMQYKRVQERLRNLGPCPRPMMG